ncbi:MAG: hypothetical protein IKL18_00405 [Oscillospiraceae bacterium]|nr:hypothetical protein [Oscillospiraceae bacterium]MBR6656621.1 hypothetical protein [Oscillospiraceae bacterium]
MNKTENNKKEGRPVSELICGIISILFGLAMIKVFINPFGLFFFVGVFFVVGGVVTVKESYKTLRRRNGKPVDEDDMPPEEVEILKEEIRCPNCEALLQKGDHECPYCKSKL